MKVIRQSSTFRFWWDVGIVCFIFVSCLIIPFQLTFKQEGASISGGWFIYLIDLLFLLDIYFNFRTSFQKGGSEITDKKKIQKRYLRSFFFFDLIANLPFDLLIFIIAPNAEFLQLPLFLLWRLPRLLRIVRLLIIIRRWEWLEWTNPTYIRIFRFLFLITFVVHWIACTWFLTGYIDGFPENSWVAAAGIEDASPSDQYIRSLYWTITTMTTVGYGDITPQRSVEYLMAMIVMAIGASTYAFIIGSLASLFSNLNAARAQYRNQVEATAQFLQKQQVPPGLNAKIRDYYQYLWTRRHGFRETDFNDLPTAIRLEILEHLTKEIQEKVPLIRECPPVLRDELLGALQMQILPPGTWVAKSGSIGAQIFFISHGKLEVLSDKENKVYTTLEGGEYFGFLPILLNERRTASVRTLTYCEMLVLEAHDFERIKKNYKEFKEVMKKISSERSEKMANLILEGIII